jgi:hypothetical protein
MLQILINNLRNLERLGGYEWTIAVFDDGSEPWLNPQFTDYYCRAPENHGKRNYWKWINYIFDWIKHQKEDFDYVCFLADDLIPRVSLPDILDELDTLEDWVALNLMEDGREKQWNGMERQDYSGSFWRSFFVDGCFIAPISTFKDVRIRIDPKRFRDKRASSGVWESFTKQILRKGKIYQVKNNLFYHGDHESFMNPEERKRNPIIAK